VTLLPAIRGPAWVRLWLSRFSYCSRDGLRRDIPAARAL